MILEINDLKAYLRYKDTLELAEFPKKNCDCALCKIGIIMNLTLGNAYVLSDVLPGINAAIKLHERFGQCDTELLKKIL